MSANMGLRVAVLGATGGIGQSLALLLKSQLPAGSALLLYDLANVAGVAADLSHIDTQVEVLWAQGTLPPTPNDPNLRKLLRDVDIVVITAGRAVVAGQDKDKHDLNRQELFDSNAGIIVDLVRSTAMAARDPCYLIISNPVNSLVPIAAEVLKKMGRYNKNKLFGITALDVMRATAFANELCHPVHQTAVPVIGAHSGPTIIPVFSQVRGLKITPEEQKRLIARVQNAGNEVLIAKNHKGTATHSIAFAASRFTLKVVRGLMGDYSTTTFAFVDTDGSPEYPSPFMAIPISLGRGGIAARLPIGTLNDIEKQALEVGLKELKQNIEVGTKWSSKL